MEKKFTKNLKPYNLNHLRYISSHNKTFLQRNRKNKQRLIPLTKEIQETMMDFSAPKSSSSVSQKSFCNMSLSNLVKGEDFNSLQELSISDQLLRKEDIVDIIEKCLNEKIRLIKDIDADTQHIVLSDANEEFEITVEETTEDRDKNILIIEYIKKLEHRTTKLEKRVNSMLKKIKKVRKVNANINANKEHNGLYKSHTNNIIPWNIYDYIFYTTRECKLNLLNYKKSVHSMELNQKRKWNPYVRPATNIMPQPGEKFKKRSMFLME